MFFFQADLQGKDNIIRQFQCGHRGRCKRFPLSSSVFTVKVKIFLGTTLLTTFSPDFIELKYFFKLIFHSVNLSKFDVLTTKSTKLSMKIK